MRESPSRTPKPGSVRVCAGVDWAKDDHLVCVVGADGEVLERFTVGHDGAGLVDLTRRLRQAEVVDAGSNVRTGRSSMPCSVQA